MSGMASMSDLAWAEFTATAQESLARWGFRPRPARYELYERLASFRKTRAISGQPTPQDRLFTALEADQYEGVRRRLNFCPPSFCGCEDQA
ncbi:hypothetical protein [Deinococcus arenicola]|uniref:Uncharacterized protein n=1 Tax=Deinococcus arenicola TaxID=2994950 RepID=A0ABU4DWX9_9DEIO|nr:hypothetical protein [Deinococcus sp. ZS9-10]MDV6376462.1 hypothetical protein [Deinococcus sp. ZS9-10]